MTATHANDASDRTLPGLPRKRPDVAVDTAGVVSTLRPADGPEVVVNDTALAIWELCDGQTTVEEMVDAASELFGTDPGDLERDVVDVLTRLGANGVIEWVR